MLGQDVDEGGHAREPTWRLKVEKKPLLKAKSESFLPRFQPQGLGSTAVPSRFQEVFALFASFLESFTRCKVMCCKLLRLLARPGALSGDWRLAVFVEAAS